MSSLVLPKRYPIISVKSSYKISIGDKVKLTPQYLKDCIRQLKSLKRYGSYTQRELDKWIEVYSTPFKVKHISLTVRGSKGDIPHYYMEDFQGCFGREDIIKCN